MMIPSANASVGSKDINITTAKDRYSFPFTVILLVIL
jgi:hypothetical protein